MTDPEKKKGHYLGTEIEETWWRRYTADRFLARGLGEYWLDDANFYFHRYFIESPIVIPLDALAGGQDREVAFREMGSRRGRGQGHLAQGRHAPELRLRPCG